jgi:phospholipid/cholesterol/gamma-HCH transport system substrate-binding protein
VENIESIPPRDGKRYRVEFSARSGWKIPRNSVARVFSPSLLAAFNINIREGDSSEFLEPGGELEGESYPDMFNAVAGAADEARTLLIRLQESAGELNKLLGAENRKHISSSIRRLDESLGHFDRLLVDVDEFVNENSGGLTRTVSDLQLSIGTVAEHVDDISQNLDQTSRNLREFSRQVRNNPGVLLRGKPVSAEDMGATP